MHFVNYFGNAPNKLRAVHDKLVVRVHQNRNFSRISFHEQCIAGTGYPERQLVVSQE